MTLMLYAHLVIFIGVFIVHKSSPILTEWPLMVGDWYHLEGHTIETINPGSVETEDKGSGGNFFASRFLRDYGVDNTPLTATIWTSALINGRGRFNNDSYPLTKFHVKHGNTYRFRMVNVGADFTLQVSIDSHPMLIVALDGHDIVPVETDYIMIAVGERVDFEIRANQTEGRYWLRAESPEDPKNRTAGHDVKAMLVYEHIPDDLDPTSQQMPCTSALKCRIFNCPFTAFPETYNMVCIHLTDVKSNQDAKTTASQYGVKDTNVQEVFFNVGASVNSKKFIVPSAPMFQEDSVTVPCETACLDMTKGCKCTNTVILLFNKTIQVIISNFQPAWHAGHHPMHIHGHSFTVVKIGFPIQNKTSGHYVGFNTDVLCDDNGRRCWSTQWTGSARSLTKVSNPVIKDTVVVPARGYVVLRFRARNPGFWLLHCHMNHHILNGMAVLLDEGVGYYPPPPDHFPTCHSFDMTKEQFSTYKMTYDNYFNGPGNLSFIVGTTPTPAPSNTNAPGTDLVCLPSGKIHTDALPEHDNRNVLI